MSARKPSLLFFLSILFLLCAGCASSQRRTAQSGAGTSKVVFENEKVRVIEYHTGSEKDICGAGLHSHPPHVYIMTTNAKLRIVTPDGKETIENARAGDVGWEPAVEHRAENVTGNNAGCYVIEIKEKDWKPSTGLKSESGK